MNKHASQGKKVRWEKKRRCPFRKKKKTIQLTLKKKGGEKRGGSHYSMTTVPMKKLSVEKKRGGSKTEVRKREEALQVRELKERKMEGGSGMTSQNHDSLRADSRAIVIDRNWTKTNVHRNKANRLYKEKG